MEVDISHRHEEAEVTKRKKRSSVANTHKNYTDKWWTSAPWWDWVSRTLGVPQGKVFDPCPRGWRPGDLSGLQIPWEQNSYVNHPGARGSTPEWWGKLMMERARHKGRLRVIWCAFNSEQERHMYPSPFGVPGWWVRPRARAPFVWGSETVPEKRNKKGKLVEPAKNHGELVTSPSNWATWWTTVEPAEPPVDCVIVRTG